MNTTLSNLMRATDAQGRQIETLRERCEDYRSYAEKLEHSLLYEKRCREQDVSILKWKLDCHRSHAVSIRHKAGILIGPGLWGIAGGTYLASAFSEAVGGSLLCYGVILVAAATLRIIDSFKVRPI